MQIQVNHDNHIKAGAELAGEVESDVASALERFTEQITRVEVHLSDVNGPKGGDDDIRCLLEARLSGLHPMAVSHQAASLEEALDGALEKLEHAIEKVVDKLHDHKGRTSYGGDQVI